MYKIKIDFLNHCNGKYVMCEGGRSDRHVWADRLGAGQHEDGGRRCAAAMRVGFETSHKGHSGGPSARAYTKCCTGTISFYLCLP